MANRAWARSYRNRVLLALVALVVLGGAIVGGLWLLRRDDAGGMTGKALARELGLPARHDCGKDVERFRLSRHAEAVTVFVPSTSWHWVRRCLDDLLEVSRAADEDAYIHDFMEQQVLRLLSRKLVRFHKAGDEQQWRLKQLVGEDGSVSFAGVDRLSIVNRNGVAHNAMAQAAVGTWFLKAARTLAEAGRRPDTAAAYEALGLAAVDVILDPVSAGGLSSTHACELRPDSTCTWYHAATKRSAEQPGEGGTLNKHLIVISRLAQAADALARIDAAAGGTTRPDAALRLEGAARAGLYQLVYAEGHVAAGRPPNLFDYVARDPEGNPIARSWLYYGLNPTRDRPGYYLTKNAFKNCHYHIVDMRVLGEAIASAGGGADLSGFGAHRAEFGGSILEYIVRVLETKQSEGLFADAETEPPGNWAGCRENMYSASATGTIAAALLAAVP